VTLDQKPPNTCQKSQQQKMQAQKNHFNVEFFNRIGQYRTPVETTGKGSRFLAPRSLRHIKIIGSAVSIMMQNAREGRARSGSVSALRARIALP